MEKIKTHMKRLYFKYGAMGSSKSAQALMTAFNYRQRGYHVLLIKPKIDTRENDSIIKSRIGLTATCTLVDKQENIFNLVTSKPDIQVVIVDEAQFCTKEQIDQLKKLTQSNITIICYGLKNNFKGELFEGSKRLIELAESLQEIKSVCRCGNKATMNARISNDKVITNGNEIDIGGDEKYEGMCYACWEKYQTEPIPKIKINEN